MKYNVFCKPSLPRPLHHAAAVSTLIKDYGAPGLSLVAAAIV